MISIKYWKTYQASVLDPTSKDFGYESCFVGSELSLDDRLNWINEFSSLAAKEKITIFYNHEAAEIHLSNVGAGYNIGSTTKIIPPSGRILFDATSLLLPELLYLMEWANSHNKDFDVIYVEPSEYSGANYRSKIGFQSIDYSLSEDGPGINMLPRFTAPINNSHLVVALGYEGHRFGALLISDEITPKSITGMLGVPPFVLGWEKNTYAKNHNEMSDARKQYDAEFMAVSANDPLQNYDAMKTICKSLAALDPKGRARIHLAPIGTKPVALAMSWFAINHQGTGILYDFVKKKQKRSTGLGKVHLWSFYCH